MIKHTTLVIVAAGFLISLTCANAETMRAAIIDGDVYLKGTSGLKRLTRDGKNSDVTVSRDGSLIAYVHNEGQEDMASLYVCVAVSGQCRKLVAAQQNRDPSLDLTNISSPRFSYQASITKSGAAIGSIFFMAGGWVTSGAIHRATLGPTAVVTFVTDANSLAVVSAGKFAGALDITQHIYAPEGGACEQERIFDPNTRTVLQNIPTAECQALHIQ